MTAADDCRSFWEVSARRLRSQTLFPEARSSAEQGAFASAQNFLLPHSSYGPLLCAFVLFSGLTLCLKSHRSFLDRVSTTCGSGWIDDQPAILLVNLNS